MDTFVSGNELQCGSGTEASAGGFEIKYPAYRGRSKLYLDASEFTNEEAL